MRVLVVEDEPQIAADLAEILQRSGYVVERAADGEDGLFRAETEDFSLIILDLGLPRLDGISVLKRLRQSGMLTPVLILTARGSWMERVEGIDAGADDYLPKPFHAEELLARAGAVIRRCVGITTPLLNAGRVRIDTRRMTTHLDDRPVSLTPLEFRAMRYLLHNKARVVPQGELVEHVYAGDAEPDSNALEVLIARLRRKLGADVITTRRGHGYIVEV